MPAKFLDQVPGDGTTMVRRAAKKYSPGGGRRPAKGCSGYQPLLPSWKSRLKPWAGLGMEGE